VRICYLLPPHTDTDTPASICYKGTWNRYL